MPAFNLSSPVAIPGAAFSGKYLTQKYLTLTFKLLWSVNLSMETNAVALQGNYQLPCKFEIFWLCFEPYLIMHWSTCVCVFGPETQLHIFVERWRSFVRTGTNLPCDKLWEVPLWTACMMVSNGYSSGQLFEVVLGSCKKSFTVRCALTSAHFSVRFMFSPLASWWDIAWQS